MNEWYFLHIVRLEDDEVIGMGSRHLLLRVDENYSGLLISRSWEKGTKWRWLRKGIEAKTVKGVAGGREE